MLKRRQWHERLGALATPMIDCMSTRGPDSAGLAVYREPLHGDLRRFGLHASNREFDWSALFEQFQSSRLLFNHGDDAQFDSIENHASVVSSVGTDDFRSWLDETFPMIDLVSVGRAMEMFKDEGLPGDILRRYRFTELGGTHVVAHTRMATESAVSPAHAHPYTAGEDFCLVHNGSLSNPHSIRRRLQSEGIQFQTDNDTEAGCRFLEWRMREGDSLEEAIETSFKNLDGFFTFLMATANQLVLVRDAFACKPAVVAETDDYVAVASEFRSLAHLPDIQSAHVFEPSPQQVYSWSVSTN